MSVKGFGGMATFGGTKTIISVSLQHNISLNRVVFGNSLYYSKCNGQYTSQFPYLYLYVIFIDNRGLMQIY